MAPRREVKRLQQIVQAVEDDELKEYLQKAERCFRGGAYRAVIILGWCAVIHYLRREVALLMGLPGFLRGWELRYGERRKPGLGTVEDLHKVKDSDFLEVLKEVGFVTPVGYDRLEYFLKWRNRCAHPGPSLGDPSEIVLLFANNLMPFLPGQKGGWRLPSSLIAYIAVDEAFVLTDLSARLFIERIYEDHKDVAKKLLERYFEPDLVRHHKRILLLWKYLALRLDEASRVAANRKCAELLPLRASSTVPLYPVVFWPQLPNLNPSERRTIIEFALPELRGAINRREPIEGAIRILEVMRDSINGDLREECEGVLREALSRHQ